MAGHVFPLSESAVEQSWRRARKRAIIKKLYFHDLRHGATSRLIEKGLNPMTGGGHHGAQDMANAETLYSLEGRGLGKDAGVMLFWP